MKRLVILDADLTIIDYRPRGYEAYKKTAVELQKTYPDVGVPGDRQLDSAHMAAQDSLFYPTQRQICEILFQTVDPEISAKIWDQQGYGESPVPGAEETLQRLHGLGYPVAIATDKNMERLYNALEEAGISKEHFVFIASSSGTGLHKPNPGFFTQVVQGHIDRTNTRTDHECDLEHAVYFGDHPFDYVASELSRRQVGGPIGLVSPSGFFSRGELKKFPGKFENEISGVPEDQILDTITSLPDWLENGY